MSCIGEVTNLIQATIFLSYRFIMTLRLSRQCKNVKVQDTRGLHRPPDQ